MSNQNDFDLRATLARMKAAAEQDRRMNAYYYGFDHTGVDLIDAVLSAVAIAGKAYHHTESWSDGEPSYVQRIQDAANEAATTILALIAAVEAVMGERDRYRAALSEAKSELLATMTLDARIEQALDAINAAILTPTPPAPEGTV